MNNPETAKVFKAFCDENRLEIIELLKKGEMCANDILKNVGIVQSTLSHHMKILCESGIITSRKSGKMTYYAVSDEGIDLASNLLDTYRGVSAPKPQPKRTEPAKKVSHATDIGEDDTWTKMVTFID